MVWVTVELIGGVPFQSFFRAQPVGAVRSGNTPGGSVIHRMCTGLYLLLRGCPQVAPRLVHRGYLSSRPTLLTLVLFATLYEPGPRRLANHARRQAIGTGHW